MRNLPPLERLRQRSRLYLGRAARSAARAAPRRKCIYMHVPKCGGTSVSEGLYATIPLEQRIAVLPSPEIRRSQSFLHRGTQDIATFHDEGDAAGILADFREQLVLLHIAEGRALIHGHFLFTERIRALSREEGYGYVSILRDPVARTVSNYRMASRNGVFEGDLDAFLDSAMGRRMALHVLRFFSGRATIAPGEEEAALEVAHANMALFDLIGFLDDLDGFARDYGEIFGNRPRIAHYNRATDRGIDVTPAQRARLEALCAPDIELTELARARR